MSNGGSRTSNVQSNFQLPTLNGEEREAEIKYRDAKNAIETAEKGKREGRGRLILLAHDLLLGFEGVDFAFETQGGDEFL